jgi:methylenetetrahydrofolate reductase (NADPH)
MPVTSGSRLRRVLELTGERTPVDLARILESDDSPEAQFEAGVEHAISLASEVLRGGAPGLHLYTFNQHKAVLSVLDGAGLLPATPTAKENERV